MDAKRLVVAGKFGPAGEQFKVDANFADTRHDSAASACDAIVHDPAYVPDWPGFLAHAAQIEAIEGDK